MPQPSDLLRGLLAEERLCLVDVGAADGLAKRWRPVADALRVIAFEPDARSDATPDIERGAQVTVVARAAAAHEGEADIHLTRKPRCSSLLAPNRTVIDRFDDPGRYDVLQRSTVPCTTVDAALARANVQMDFLKIDTQGTELDVLRGAERALATCLGVEVEVEFQPLYVDAALFRDVDAYVSGFGFELFDLRRTFFVRATAAAHVPQQKGQIIFGDALYFRHWETLPTREQVIKLAALMLVYGFGDVVAEMAHLCPLLSAGDRDALEQLCAGLQPVPRVEAARKDRFVGTGLQLAGTER